MSATMNPADASHLAASAAAAANADATTDADRAHADAAAVADAFRPFLLAAAWRVTDAATAQLGEDAVAERFPFLLDYARAFVAEAEADAGADGAGSAADPAAFVASPAAAPAGSALLRLARAAALPPAALEIWLVAGLVEEDARFGAVFEALDPDATDRRPTMALMQSWWGTAPREGLRPALRALVDCGLLRACQPGATRADTTYEVEDNCWSAARGEAPARPAPGIRLREVREAPALADLTLDAATLDAVMQSGLASGDGDGDDGAGAGSAEAAGYACLVARGAEHNGRASLLAALARAEGRRALVIDWPPESGHGAGHAASGAPPWLGAFATLADARPIVRLRATPGERLRLPAFAGYDGWIGVVCGDDDAIDDLPAPALVLRLPLPDATRRGALVARHGGPALAPIAAEVAARLHLSSGHLVSALRRVGGAAPASARNARAADAAMPATAAAAAAAATTPAADPATDPARTAARLREIALAGGACELDNLARRIDTPRIDPPHLAPPAAHERGPDAATTPAADPRAALVLDADLTRDLATLEARCAQRDQLRATLPAAFAARLNAGVRALFAGPSGTGKTLAAQVLAARLGLPLYRLDLSSVVSKYIGETERNLHRLLSAAEALDVMLLLDEGDALLARRTEVGNAHDRYANLETNFLLQRLETHRGLVLVTTNALERIDTAFLRRFDLLVHFRAPEFAERLALWRAHLPPDHAVADAALDRIAEACALAGGQVRNVVLDAASAALAHASRVTEPLLMDALRREYRRGGALFPLGR